MQGTAEHIAAGAATAEEPAPPRDFTIDLIERWQDLESEIDAWNDLANHAVEPNCFYTPEAVLAAMRHLKLPGEPAFLVVRGWSTRPTGAPIWCGFFPFVRHRTYRGLPVVSLRLLKHDYCYLSVPLVRADCVGDVLRHVFAWLDGSGASIAELGNQTGDGPYAQALSARLRRRHRRPWRSSSHERALLRCAGDAETYIEGAVSRKKLRGLNRQRRRLSERGELCVERVPPRRGVERSLGEFLALEASGWKGTAGTAMSCSPAHRDFFRDLARSAARDGRLRMTTLRLDGRPIAMKCDFITPPGAFAFKIAYAEELSQFSPGVLLELENIRRLHAEPGVAWMDSCAAPGHPMLERLWREQRPIESWVVPLDILGRIATAALALLQTIKRTLC